MKRRWWAALAGPWLIAAGGAGCRPDLHGTEGARLSVRWTGPDTSAFSAHAVAEWCPSLHLLEIRAIAGDSGIAIALYPADSIEAGVYPVRRPDVADTTGAPSAAVGLRWFSRTVIMGYQGDSGRVVVERDPGGSLAGRFAVAARSLVAGARLTMTGTFQDLRIVTAAPTCAGRHPGKAARRDSTAAGAAPDTSD
ncbi:MAG TPA: hypothetical protein VJQ46_00570 [Gemmatimonadales bacterium]|nr:hypothetical protein [Gemmatimonadales bacterium]